MSGLLPRNPGAPSGATGAGFFSSLTVGSLIVTGLASLGTLLVSGATTLTGILSVASSVWSDVYANFTAGHTVTLETRSANANVLLSPNGTGQVVVSAGTTLTADILASTAPTQTLRLLPSGTFVSVGSGKTLTADTIGTTSASTSLTLSPTGPSVIVFSGVGLTADTLSPTSAATPLTITAPTGQNIDITPVGAGKAIIASGKTLSADTLASTTAATNLSLSPTGAAVVVASGKTLEADIWASTTAATNLSINPTGAFVLVAAGKQLSADTIGTTASGALTLVTTSGQNIALSPGAGGAVTVGGAVAADTSTKLLALGASNAVVYQDTLSGQGVGPWTPVSGFTGSPTVVVNFMRIGNVVSCAASIGPMSAALGANTATLTLPIARGTNFASIFDATGTVVWQSTIVYNQALIQADTSANNLINVGLTSAAAASGFMYISFLYHLVL